MLIRRRDKIPVLGFSVFSMDFTSEDYRIRAELNDVFRQYFRLFDGYTIEAQTVTRVFIDNKRLTVNKLDQGVHFCDALMIEHQVGLPALADENIVFIKSTLTDISEILVDKKSHIGLLPHSGHPRFINIITDSYIHDIRPVFRLMAESRLYSAAIFNFLSGA